MCEDQAKGKSSAIIPVMKKFTFPETVSVKVTPSESGYFIEIPELDAFTEATTKQEIPEMVSDLIFTIFDVPKKMQGAYETHQDFSV